MKKEYDLSKLESRPLYEENRCRSCGRYMRYYSGWVYEGQHEEEYVCDNPKCQDPLSKATGG